MTQPAAADQQATSKRGDMPRTAKWIDERRAEYGRAWVDECIRRGMAGQAGAFYAIEGGYVVGAPFAAGDPALLEWQAFAIMAGVKFAGFMARPPEQKQEG